VKDRKVKSKNQCSKLMIILHIKVNVLFSIYCLMLYFNIDVLPNQMIDESHINNY